MDRSDQQSASELSRSCHAPSPVFIRRGILKTAERSSKGIKSIESDKLASRFAQSRQSKVSAQLSKSRAVDWGAERSFHQLLRDQGEMNATCRWTFTMKFFRESQFNVKWFLINFLEAGDDGDDVCKHTLAESRLVREIFLVFFRVNIFF